MSARVPVWTLLLFAVIAIVLGVLGVGHSAETVGQILWVVIIVIGLANLAFAYRGWKIPQNSDRGR